MKSVKKVVKYGTEVFSNIEMDEIRKTECLCLNCHSMPDCRVAKDLYEMCHNCNIATMMTRCPGFFPKEV